MTVVREGGYEIGWGFCDFVFDHLYRSLGGMREEAVVVSMGNTAQM
jgi:hypothetical protein